MIKYQKDIDNIAIVRLDMSNSVENIITNEIVGSFEPLLKHLLEEKAKGKLRGVILTSDKKTFVTGGDLNFLQTANDAATIFTFAERIKTFFRSLERPGVPVVAAINGTALGNGFELALACHYKIAINKSDCLLGLPEVNFGVMPLGGGTVRLLWKMGIEKAFAILKEGRRYTPKQALALGLIDEIADDENDLLERARAWLFSNPEGRQPWDRANYNIPYGTFSDIAVARRVTALSASLTRDGSANYPAPYAILQTLAEGSKLDFDTACRIESRAFTDLALSKVAKNMIQTLWYDFKAIKENANRPKGFGKFRPKKVGIIGAGLMGSGIAFVCANHQLDVVLKDVSKSVAERGKAFSEKKLNELAQMGELTKEDKRVILERIRPTENFADFEECDLVIEAVFENQKIKEKVAKETASHLDEYAFFASNTSHIPITQLATAFVQPANFIGLHFFSPVETEPLVEVVKGEQTSDETIARAFDFIKKIKKIPVLVKDHPGFFVARVQNTYVLEGVSLVQEGYAPAVVEQLGVRAGMPSGPLDLADRLSLKVVLGAERQAADYFGKKYVEHPATALLKVMVEKLGRSGKFNGAGFYDYNEGQRTNLWQGLSEHVDAKKIKIDEETEIIERLLFVQAIEALWCLERGVISNEGDANICSIYGWGFPSAKGGVLRFIVDYGREAFIKRATMLARQHGPRYRVPKTIINIL